MPVRKIYFRKGYFYHLYNRSIDGQVVFQEKRDIRRFLSVMNFYRYKNPPVRFSHFLNFELEERENILKSIRKKNDLLVEILCYAVMPNHYHLLVKQLSDDGVSWFVSNIQNSYARYFNTKNKRAGHLFQGIFRGVLIESEQQLIHVARYIEINPLTSFLLKNFSELLTNERVSLREYINQVDGLCEKRYIMSYFKTIKRYLHFLQNQVDYQRKLGKIKNLLLEEKLLTSQNIKKP